MAKFLPHENKEDKRPLGILLETERPKENINASKISWGLTKNWVFDLYCLCKSDRWLMRDKKKKFHLLKIWDKFTEYGQKKKKKKLENWKSQCDKLQSQGYKLLSASRNLEMKAFQA